MSPTAISRVNENKVDTEKSMKLEEFSHQKVPSDDKNEGASSIGSIQLPIYSDVSEKISAMQI